MTQKELLYLEDAVGHEKSIISICKDIINNLDDERLIKFMQNELGLHENLKEELLNMLEVKSNG